MTGMRRLIFMTAGLGISLLLSSCTKIHTDDSGEQAGLTAEYKADKIRADWENRIRSASPLEKAGLLADYFEMVTGMYFQVGYQTMDNWRAFERQAQREVDSVEVQAMIDQWYIDNRAYISAHNENIDYAAREVKYSGYFTESFLVELGTLLDAYARVRDAVLHPFGSLTEYEYAFKQLEFETSEIVRQYREKLKLL